MNLHDERWERDQDREGYRWRAKRTGGDLIGAGLYDLPAGERTWPYHYHHGTEEWLLVVAGRPTLRTPEGERVLEEGDVVCFPAGPAGAHQVTGLGRVLIVSDLTVPRTSHYPDSDKVSARTSAEDALVFRAGDAVDYWEGE